MASKVRLRDLHARELKILRHYSDFDPSMSNGALADAIRNRSGASFAEGTAKKYRTTVEQELIESFTIKLAAELRLQFNISFLFIELENRDALTIEKFQSSLSNIPFVSSIYSLNGTLDYILKLTTPRSEEIRDLVNFLVSLDMVRDVHTHPLFDVIPCGNHELDGFFEERTMKECIELAFGAGKGGQP